MAKIISFPVRTQQQGERRSGEKLAQATLAIQDVLKRYCATVVGHAERFGPTKPLLDDVEFLIDILLTAQLQIDPLRDPWADAHAEPLCEEVYEYMHRNEEG